MIDSDSLQTLLRRDPILFVDAGARGDLEGGWKDIPNDCLAVLAFEPDPEAPIDWDGRKPGWHLERCALWSSQTTLDVHIGKIAATSSVWPPNASYLGRFASKHAEPRETQTTVRVAAQPLDAVAAKLGMRPDFIKIDTQGAELQILEGAEAVLANDAFGVLVETWTVPVHAGQGLSHEVMALMHERGFALFQVEVAAAWDRKVVERDDVSMRRQTVGLDLLFFRDPVDIADRFRTPSYAAKFALAAQMYGHYDLALEILDLGIARAGDTDAALLAAARRDIVTAYARWEADRAAPPRPALAARIARMLRSALGRNRSGPDVSKLHY